MNAQELQATLESFQKEGAHLLLPSTYIPDIPKYHTVAVERVFLSPDKSEGDVYTQKQKLALTRQGLMKLANAAGMIWDPSGSKRLDDRTDKDYVVYQAVGGLKKLDGTPLFMKAEYDLDFEIIREETEEGYEEKKRKDWVTGKWKKDWFIRMSDDQKDEYINKCIRRDVLQKRKHKIKLAETGAMTRVIRGLLNLKSTYTVEELTKPFIVVRLVFQPDYDDPEIKSRMAAAAVGAVAGIFGPASTQPALPPASQACPVSDAEIPDALPMDDDIPGDIPTGADPEATNEGPDLGEFLGMSAKNRLSLLGAMAKNRGMNDSAALWAFWTKTTGKPAPQNALKMPEDDMVSLFEALESFSPVDDDIPF